MSINDELSEQALNDYIQTILIYPQRVAIEKKEAEKQEAERQKDYLKAATIAMEILQLKKTLK
jgi:DNA primase